MFICAEEGRPVTKEPWWLWWLFWGRRWMHPLCTLPSRHDGPHYDKARNYWWDNEKAALTTAPGDMKA